MISADEPVYRSHAYVCGALGRPDPEVLSNLVQASPTEVRNVYTGSDAVLCASQRVTAWNHDDRRGHFWNALAWGRSTCKWEEAAEQRMAAGLEVTPNSATLHGDALGVAELYTRRLGDALYFSSRIDPLTQLDSTLLHEDGAAWASILAIGAPIAGATPFAEVRRMDAAAGWRFTGSRFEPLSFEPRWMSVEPRHDIDPPLLVDMLARQMPRHRLLGRTALTLSGGWDSRLLAALATRASRRQVLAWTTDPDTGHDLDVQLSRPVAARLGLRQRVLTPPLNAWTQEASPVRRRLQHQSWLHTWIMPLARTLHRRGEPLLDGLAGDVLLKSLLVDRGVLDAADPEYALWQVLDGGRVKNKYDFLARGLADDMESASRTAFAAATARFADHPAAAALSVLTTRTARAIAASPLLLFAPETDVRLPFLDPDVIAISLSVPVDRKIGGDFYREVLLAASADIAGLPSTNDPYPPPTLGQRRQLHPEALMSMSQLILSDDHVRTMLGSSLQKALESDESLAAIVKQPRLINILQWAAMLADWRSTYQGTLAT